MVMFNQFTKFRETLTKGEEKMYKNVKAEMARQEMTIGDLATAIGMDYQALWLRLKGKATISVETAVKIKNALKTDVPIEVLFEKKEASV